MQQSYATELAPPPDEDRTVIGDETEIADSPRHARVSIKVLQTVDPSQVRTQTLGLPCVIGRKDADMTISGDPKISRDHVEIAIENGEFTVIDRGSANGTLVEDTKLQKGGSIVITGRTTLQLGPNTVVEVEPLA